MYKKLAIVVSINTVLMFLLTYANLDSWDHFYANINRVYMALIMVAPMVAVMLMVMGSMYKNKRLNLILYAVLAIVFVGSFLGIRTQTPIGDDQFLRSMIPHHSSAILVCQESALTDPEILALCDEIIQAQEEEIAQMKAILERR